MSKPLVLLESYSAARDPDSFAFSGPCGEIAAHTCEEVIPALEAVQRAVDGGLHAAGFLAYEAAAGLDPVLQTHHRPPQGLPLLWFGLFQERLPAPPRGVAPGRGYSVSDWRPTVTRQDFDAAIGRVRDYIAAGDTYQVNYTFRMRARLQGDGLDLYRDLCRSQRASYCAYLDLGRYRILSASPELFFSLRDGVLTSRPMKGTRPRGRWPGEDDDLVAALVDSPKDRAENVMIVDLVRNDLGRVSQVGSVRVPRLWDVERYETVLQMTSTVTSRARPGAGLVELMGALFPCGSITGAPKVRTMEIIAELEGSPRGVYTGAIGFVSPGPECRFNVAIRTVVLDTADGSLEFGVGGGITWDSSAAGEYEECLVKARVLGEARILHERCGDFDLLETMLHEPGQGYFLLERHLERLGLSARYFDRPFDATETDARLRAEAAALADRAAVSRLLLAADGSLRVEHLPPPATRPGPWRVALCPLSVHSGDPMLYHKSTARAAYEERRSTRPDCDEVILVNQRGEVTECCIGNLVAVIGGSHWTPPPDSGLLPGTYRAELLARGEIRERVLTPDDLRRAQGLYLINAVRRRVPLELVD